VPVVVPVVVVPVVVVPVVVVPVVVVPVVVVPVVVVPVVVDVVPSTVVDGPGVAVVGVPRKPFLLFFDAPAGVAVVGVPKKLVCMPFLPFFSPFSSLFEFKSRPSTAREGKSRAVAAKRTAGVVQVFILDV
jgi:hypothetical protein